MSLLSLNLNESFRQTWVAILMVLEVMGFVNNLIGMIKAMYSNPSAWVLPRTWRTFSSLFLVSRSSRQGYPLHYLSSPWGPWLKPFANVIWCCQYVFIITSHYLQMMLWSFWRTPLSLFLIFCLYVRRMVACQVLGLTGQSLLRFIWMNQLAIQACLLTPLLSNSLNTLALRCSLP